MFDKFYVGASGYYFGNDNAGIAGQEEGEVENANVTWEKDKMFNIGIESEFLNRIFLKLDYFNNSRTDILVTPFTAVPLVTGVNFPQLNLGKVDNKGIELVTGFRSSMESDFRFFTELSIWYAKNEIVFNSEAYQKDDYLYRSGQSIGQPFVLKDDGFFRDEQDIADHPFQVFETVRPGDLKYVDQNDDGYIDQNDLYPLGKPSLPELSSALKIEMGYKNFDFNLFFHGVASCTAYQSGYYYHAFQNDGKVSPVALGRWTASNAAEATYPRLSSKDNMNNFQPSTFWQKDGSFIKLRNIEIGYSLQESAINRIGLEALRIYVNGTNLFSLDHIDDTDPESMYGYPGVRTYSLGLKIQF